MKPVKKWFDEISEDYIYGFITGIVFLSVFLATQYGYNFCFLSGSGFLSVPLPVKTLHWVTMIWLCLMYSIFYYRLRSEPGFRRLFISFCFLMFFWQIHDSLWLIKWSITGANIYGSPLIYPTLFNLVIGFSRSFVLFTLSLAVIKNYFKISKDFIVLLVFQFAYWVFLMFPEVSMKYHDLMFSAPFIQIVDSLPYFWIVKGGNTH